MKTFRFCPDRHPQLRRLLLICLFALTGGWLAMPGRCDWTAACALFLLLQILLLTGDAFCAVLARKDAAQARAQGCAKSMLKAKELVQTVSSACRTHVTAMALGLLLLVGPVLGGAATPEMVEWPLAVLFIIFCLFGMAGTCACARASCSLQEALLESSFAGWQDSAEDDGPEEPGMPMEERLRQESGDPFPGRRPAEAHSGGCADELFREWNSRIAESAQGGDGESGGLASAEAGEKEGKTE